MMIDINLGLGSAVLLLALLALRTIRPLPFESRVRKLSETTARRDAVAKVRPAVAPL